MKTSAFKLGVLAFIVITGISAGMTVRASAAFYLYGRQPNHSYYTNEVSTGEHYVFAHNNPQADPAVDYDGITADWDTVNMTVNSFVATMKAHLASTDPIMRARTAIIMNMMLGVDATDSRLSCPSATCWQKGVTLANSNLVQWEKVIRAYDAAGKVQWNGKMTPAAANTEKDWLGFNDVATDNVRQPDMVSITLKAAQPADDAILFLNDDGSVRFTIKKKCANLAGDITPLDQTVVVTPPPPTPPPPTPPPTPPSRPYFQATGGDVLAGASFSTATLPCSTAMHIDKAGISSWNTNTGTFSGAGTTYAVQAWRYIQEFASAQTTGVPPTGLSFANQDSGNSVDTANGYFGGLFESAPCVDYWGTQPTAMATFSGTNVGAITGNASYNGDVKLSGATLPTGYKGALYVEGNVAITSNITYADGWASASQIPSFKLIVHGSIFIDPSVTQLDGLYVAVPDDNYAGSAATDKRDFTSASTKKGTITTCSLGSGDPFKSYDPGQALTNSIATACANKLVFNGSVVANQVWLLRSAGSLGTGTAAETFNYPVDAWLGGSNGRSISNNGYESIKGLPPVL